MKVKVRLLPLLFDFKKINLETLYATCQPVALLLRLLTNAPFEQTEHANPFTRFQRVSLHILRDCSLGVVEWCVAIVFKPLWICLDYFLQTFLT